MKFLSLRDRRVTGERIGHRDRHLPNATVVEFGPERHAGAAFENFDDANARGGSRPGRSEKERC